jgi:hypothetical protein
MGLDPVSLAVIGAAGAGMSAIGSYEQGQAKSQAAMYQAQVAANNAAIARQNAVFEIQGGETEATNVGLRIRAAIGAEKARQGASGINVNKGTAVDVRAGTEELGMLDALTVRSNAARKAYGYQVSATSDVAQSGLLQMEGSQAQEAGDIGAAASLLSGASTVGGNYMKLQNQQKPGTVG